eukprot:2620967-Alexandrium_andersonii.AAC.1
MVVQSGKFVDNGIGLLKDFGALPLSELESSLSAWPTGRVTECALVGLGPELELPAALAAINACVAASAVVGSDTEGAGLA